MAEGLQKRFQSEVEKYREFQKEAQKAIRARQQLEAQLTENNIVKDELDHLEPNASVYKLIGPALVKQDLAEAKQTVAKRLDYITNEIKRQESLLKEIEKKQETQREAISKLQAQVQQVQVKAALKS